MHEIHLQIIWEVPRILTCPFYDLVTSLLKKQVNKLHYLHVVGFFPKTYQVHCLSKNSQHFYGTRSFTTAVTNVRYLSPSWATAIQSMLPHPISRSPILTRSSHWRLGLQMNKWTKLNKICIHPSKFTQKLT